MSIRFILPLLSALSICMTGASAYAEDVTFRCAHMYLNQSLPDSTGYTLKRMKIDTVDIGDSIVVTEPRMAGLRGPNISLLGRDVRLAVIDHQTSPQELWHKGVWNVQRLQTPCARKNLSWKKSLIRGYYGTIAIETTAGLNNYDPAILHRTRLIAEGLQVRPYGFMFGVGVASTIATNSDVLEYLPDTRPPVRRDMVNFGNPLSIDRLYASWHNTPITDLHVGITGGYLEEMYAGAGAEIIYRPWNKPFWIGADGWQVWRRKPSMMDLNISNESHFTGHVRAGYDVPDSRMSFHAAAGKYLAGDLGGTLGMKYDFPSGMYVDATMTWTDREEQQGFFSNTKFDPMLRVVVPLNKNRKANQHQFRGNFRQVGRDGGQMLSRPMPIEEMTESFGTREVARAWPALFTTNQNDAVGADAIDNDGIDIAIP
ncbi:MAG TPA: YjbH domain-containing protein [Alphaproteobacteria bacterium]